MRVFSKHVVLPNNWNIEQFGRRITLSYGKSQSTVQTPNGMFPIYGTGGFMGMADQWLSRGDSVLIGRKGTLNNPLYISEPFWPVDTTFYTSAFDGSYKWLYYLLQFIDLSQWNEATGVPSLSRDTIYKIEIPFPPANEQSKIAEVLSTIDRTIEQIEALIAKQQRIKTGLMQNLLTRGIDENGRLRDSSTHRFKPTVLGMIPVEWDAKPIDEIASFVGSGVTPTGGSKVYVDDGIIFIRSFSTVHEPGSLMAGSEMRVGSRASVSKHT
jgi:type I restriction enzyme S subunit